jgi:hypothetical protein
VVLELAAAGMSTRAIAPVVGVDQKTVVRDINRGEAYASPATSAPERRPAAPEPPSKIIGIDGKSYQRPAP